MNPNFARVALAATLVSLALAAPAGAALTRTVDVTPTTRADWTSPLGSGLNLTWLANTGPAKGACGTDPQNYCELTLVHVTAKDVATAALTFRIDGFGPASDFDLRVYASDPQGTFSGKTVASPKGDSTKGPLGGDDPRNTAAGDFETVELVADDAIDFETNKLDAYYLVMVPYFTVFNDKYSGHVSLATTPAAS